MNFDQHYRNLVLTCLSGGVPKKVRGHDTWSLFGYNYTLDVGKEFPILTTKRIAFKTIVTELLWFLKGRTDIQWLMERGCRIWDEWSTDAVWANVIVNEDNPAYSTEIEGEDMQHHSNIGDAEYYLKEIRKFTKVSRYKWCRGGGEVDAGYGRWWREFPSVEATDVGCAFCQDGSTEDGSKCEACFGTGYNQITKPFDQVARVIEELKTNPMSRRMVVSAWSPMDAWNAKLPPCHDMWIVNVTPEHEISLNAERKTIPAKLNLHLTQRSCDIGLGLPFNTTSYAILMHILALEAGLDVGEFNHTLVDAHIYCNHRGALLEQVQREPFKAPELVMTKKHWQDLDIGDFGLNGYKHHPKVDLEVAV